MTYPGQPKHSRGPASVKAALRAPRSRSKSLDTGLCASAYYSAIRGMSDSYFHDRAPRRVEPLSEEIWDLRKTCSNKLSLTSMRIITYNDLHLEFGSGWMLPPAVNGDRCTHRPIFPRDAHCCSETTVADARRVQELDRCDKQDQDDVLGGFER